MRTMQDNNTQNAILILTRLKSALNITSDAELASLLDIKNNTLSGWKSRGIADYKAVFALCEQKNIDIDWLITGNSRVKKTAVQIEDNTGIPLLPITAIGGTGNGDFAVSKNDIEGYYSIPDFNGKVDFMIRMAGKSMEPEYNSGDVLACKAVNDISFFQWGKVYVMDTTQGAIIKRVFPGSSKESILCQSDNASFPPFELVYAQDVRSFAVVLGSVRLN